ncbi:MAG: aspartate/glutamate racemase family protein [Pseudomonadota bacterium]
MRLALINPNTSADTTAAMVRIANEVASDEARIAGFTAPFGAELITDEPSLDLADGAVRAMAPELTGFDGVIVAAFGDPGRESLLAQLEVPVAGIAEAGMAEAAAGGRRFAVVTTTPELRQRISETAASHGHRNFAGTWTTGGDPAALMRDPDGLEDALESTITAAVGQAKVDAIIIGGGPLAVAARALAPRAPVPLIEPLPAAVRLVMARASDGHIP